MSARDDYPLLATLELPDDGSGVAYGAALDEIDQLRLENAWLRRIADDRGEENERLRAETDGMRNMLADSIVVHQDDQAEIERLRLLNARLERDFAEMNQLDPIVDRIGDINVHHGERDDGTGGCLCGRESYLTCPHWPEGGIANVEIAEVAGRIANGKAICGATWRDTEAQGWLWYCSLEPGHGGHHRCIGATW